MIQRFSGRIALAGQLESRKLVHVPQGTFRGPNTWLKELWFDSQTFSSESMGSDLFGCRFGPYVGKVPKG